MDTYEKKIREYLNNGEVDELYKNMLLNLFPELSESEDEKVRKEIVRFIQMEVEDEIVGNKWLAWLEKQGEKKPQRMISAEAKEAMYDKPAWSEEDEDFMYDTLSNLTELKDRYGEGYGNVGKCIDWLKSLKQRIGG